MSARSILGLRRVTLSGLVILHSCHRPPADERVTVTGIDPTIATRRAQPCDIAAARAYGVLNDRRIRSSTFIVVVAGDGQQDSTVVLDEVLKRPRATGHSVDEQTAALEAEVDRVRAACEARLGTPRTSSPVAGLAADTARVADGACARVARDGRGCQADVLIASDFSENVDSSVVSALKGVTKRPGSDDATRAMAALEAKTVRWPASATVSTCGGLATKKSPYTLEARATVFAALLGADATASIGTACAERPSVGGAK